MIIETLNSVYRIYADDENGVVIEKTHDKIGGDSYIPTGARFKDFALPSISLGKGASIGGMATSKVIKITPEDGDENIPFIN